MGRAIVFSVTGAFALGLGILFSSLAEAYTPTLTPGGASVRWKGSAKLNLVGNPINGNGIEAPDFFKAVVRSLQRWNAASSGMVSFDYWQGTDPDAYRTSSEYNGSSHLYFASNAKSDPHLSANVLGLTQVWYNTDTGEILETDVVLNDRDFHFTLNAKDTSGYGSGNASFGGGKPNVFVENVLTHELGHAYGLSHSGGLQSTMLFMESPEQAHLGCDDGVAIRALYPGDSAGRRGALTGSIVSEKGTPVFGAHVLAISRRRGTVMASALSDRSGKYTINALEPGAYFIMAEPFFAGSQALPSFYSGMNPDICPGGESYGRSVLTDGDANRPAAIQVGGQRSSVAPTLTVRCTNYGGAAISGASASANVASAPVVFDGVSGGKGFGVTDKFNYSNTTYYRLNNLAGHVEIHAMSYSLYSPIHPKLQLLDASGTVVDGTTSNDQVYQGKSGFVNYDASLVADVEPGDYYLRVSAKTLNSMLYPAGPLLLDSVPFLILAGSVGEELPALADEIPVNARCRMDDESFADYQSPPGGPQRASASDEDEDNGVGFCGTLDSGAGGDSGSGPGPGQIAGWFFPWMAMAIIGRGAVKIARMRHRPQTACA